MVIRLLAGAALLLATFAGVVACAMWQMHGLVVLGVVVLVALLHHACDVIRGWRASVLQEPQMPRARTVRR